MTERVILARAGSLALGLPHQLLGSDGDERWAAVAQPEMLTLVAQRLPHRLLWFERAAYERDTRKLDDAGVAAVVRFQPARMGDPVGNTLGQIIASTWRWTRALAESGAPIDRALGQLTTWVAEGNWTRAPTVELLEQATEGAARLAAAYALDGDTAAAARTEARAEALAKLTAAEGSPNYARALPYVPLHQVYVTSKTTFAGFLDKRNIAHAERARQLFFVWPSARLDTLDVAARRVSADPSGFFDLTQQAPPARDRDLDELGASDLAADAARMRALDCRNLILRLRFLGTRVTSPLDGASLEAELAAALRAQPAGVSVADARAALRDDLELAAALGAQPLPELAARAAATLAALDKEP